MKAVQKINEFLAIKSTLALGTMWCTYGFICLCLSPLLWPSEQEKLLYVSNCFQLVFLPILLVGQNILGRSAEKRAQQDHEAIMAELDLVKKINVELQELLKLPHE